MIKEGAGLAFALWITGLPSSGKSTLTRGLVKKLKKEGISVEVLESDDLRKRLFPNFSYSDEERETFYNAMVEIGKILVKNGINVIFDATANKRKWREKARREISNFAEVYVKCSLEECARRDPKGIYAQGKKGESTFVPGLQVPYEEPLKPELIIDAEKENPQQGIKKVFQLAVKKLSTPSS